VETFKETHSHPRSEGPNDVRIDSQFQRLLDNNTSNNNQITQNPNKISENKPAIKPSYLPPQSAFSKANIPTNIKAPTSNTLNETSNVNNYNSTANTKQTTFVPTSETPASNINNPFFEALSSKNAYNTNNNESLNNSIISDKGATGNKLDKLKNFLNNPSSNVIN